MVGERLKLTSHGSGRYEGRDVAKFEVSLGPESKQGFLAEQRTLAPLELAKKGADAASLRRAQFTAKRQPRAAQGEIWVDSATGVVLKAQLLASLSAPPPPKESGEAQLQLRVDSEVKGIGASPALQPPADFLPDVNKPAGIADALDRFGLPRGGKSDAGTASPTSEDDEG